MLDRKHSHLLSASLIVRVHDIATRTHDKEGKKHLNGRAAACRHGHRASVHLEAVTGDLDFPFTTVLSAGTYAMVFTVSSSAGADALLIRNREVESPNPYTGGAAFVEIDDSSWQPAETEGVNYNDLLFTISGTAVASYVFIPPVGGPTKRRLVACADNKLWYEDV